MVIQVLLAPKLSFSLRPGVTSSPLVSHLDLGPVNLIIAAGRKGASKERRDGKNVHLSTKSKLSFIYTSPAFS